MNDENNRTLGGRLKHIEISSSLSQGEFANKLGVSVQTLINYEKDRRDPPANFILNVCRIFFVGPSWLLMGEGEPSLREGGGDVGLAATSPADEDMIREIIMAVEEWLNRRGLTLEPTKKADLVIELYRRLLKEGKKVDKDTVGEVFLKLVA